MRTAYCFDLDGTLSTVEILPCIAAELGISDEIATLTRLTMDGHIPFQDSMRLRSLILGQVPLDRVREIVNSIPIDTSLLTFLREHRDDCFVVTGNLDIWIEPLLDKLGCGAFSSTARLSDGGLRLEAILDKGQAIANLRSQRRFQRIIAVGDGSNDIPMLNEADVGIAYGGVHPPVPATIASAELIVNDPVTLCNLLKAL